MAGMEPIEYLFTDEHRLFQENVRAFAETELAPGYLARAKVDSFDMDVYRKLGEFGLLGFRVPEEYGGQGDALDFVSMGIAAEEVGRADFSMGYALLAAANPLQTIINYASERIRADFLPQYIAGQVLFGMSMTEATGGSDLASMRTTAVREGDAWVLNGEKSSSSFVDAPYHVIYAKTDPEAGNRGVSAFWVEMPPESDNTVVRSTFGDIGCKPIRRGSISFNDHRIPAENLLHKENEAFKMAVQGEDAARPLLALECLGSAQAALDQAVDYSRVRTAFGKPIGANQGISFPIAEAQTMLNACRLQCFDILWKVDHGRPVGAGPSMVKWWAPSLAFSVIKQSLLVFGHFGYSDEYDLSQRLVDVMGQEIGGGTEHLNKLLVAQQIIGPVARGR